MAHFSQAFWSADYAGGLGVLFQKLQQGCQENQQILTIARLRADAEELYGQSMGEIGPATDRIQDGFQRDDGASVRKAYEGVRIEMEESSRKHRKIASNIRELVVHPFDRWCNQHATRIQNSQDDLQARVKAHDKQSEYVKKLRSQYFNKCRLVEDLEEEDKLAFKGPEKEPLQSPSMQTPTVKIQEPDEEEEPQSIEIGDSTYLPEQVKRLLQHALDNVKLGETKVPILGTYYNVTSGADIVDYIQKNMASTSVTDAEQIGQDLITNGFLRLVGNVGNTFANSSRMYYQWRPKVFQITGYPEKKKAGAAVTRSNTAMSVDSADSPIVGSVQEYFRDWNPLNTAHPNETPAEKLRRDAREADERYKAGVKKLDLLRCTLEEAIFEHLKFMERCELDRLKAIKSVILDFSGAISNVIPSLQSTVDKMMLFQETVQPLGDLRYLLENYRVGPFVPRVQPYENYYNAVDEITFGVDLEARARADRKRVPLIITTILQFLDQHYPLLDGDSVRQSIWIVDVPLAPVHRLRNEINNGQPIAHETLEKYEVPIVATCLKLYFLELPDSLVSSNLYEIIKTIYSTPATADANAAQTRINVLQNTLGQLRLANIASLDAISTHFTRLLDLTSADETYTASLAQTLAPCVLRPRDNSALIFDEKYNVRFLRDLFAHKDAIFGELKRASSLSHSASVARAMSGAAPNSPRTSGAGTVNGGDGRPRGFSSSDERDRRAKMEERARAIASNASRSRATSPAPGHRGRESGPHETTLEQQRRRRDSSREPSHTRFPVNATPPAGVPTKQNVRHSLEVPGSAEASPVGTNVQPPRSQPLASQGLASTHRRQDTAESIGSADPSMIAAAMAGMNGDPYEASSDSREPAAASSTPSTPANTTHDIEKHNSHSKRQHIARKQPGSGNAHIMSGPGPTVGVEQNPGAHVATELDDRRGVELIDRPYDDDFA